MIPPIRSRLKQRTWDRHLHKVRRLIGHFFAKPQQYRSMATRYDKTARNFFGALRLDAAVIWLN